MELDKTDAAVVYAREWSIDMIDSDIPMENAQAIYKEFEEWIELELGDDDVEVLYLESLSEYYKDWG